MDEFWISKAHKYISEHSSFSEVSGIKYSDDTGTAEIYALAIVNLPAIFIETGITKRGVRNLEPVWFNFPERFPLEAPTIRLRDDFPRDLPHINANKKTVCPCIFDGSLSELLQQLPWMNGLLNQLIDWLEKAASNSLIDYEQGWEPMRNDEAKGLISYNTKVVLDKIQSANTSHKTTRYLDVDGSLIVDEICKLKESKKAEMLVCRPENEVPVDSYIPNQITNLAELYSYAKEIGVHDIKDIIEDCDQSHLDQGIIFLVLAVPRPCNLIGSTSTWELLNFAIYKSKHRKRKKRVLPNSGVGMLSHIAPSSPELLKRLSGAKQNCHSEKGIALIGCGSIGSKIGLHLARNGNGPFFCIDNEIFLPHNGARHGLSYSFFDNKARLLSQAIFSITGENSTTGKNALTADYSNTRLIIDSTGSFSVRSFLLGNALPNIISVGLYHRGKYGLMQVENEEGTVKLCDLWGRLYLLALEDECIRDMLFDCQEDRVAVGQSCSSNTMVISDSLISLYASSFSLFIQEILEEGFPSDGEIYLMRSTEVKGLTVQKHYVPCSLPVRSLTKKEWYLRISSAVVAKMREVSAQKSPNETGGVLIGSIFLNAKIIVVSEIIDPPPDSEESTCRFILGVDGLETKIKNIERKTNGNITYLGTWHSHPSGGAASSTDENTAQRLLFVRNYEPTVCLILTPDDIFQV